MFLKGFFGSEDVLHYKCTAKSLFKTRAYYITQASLITV